MDRSTPLPNVAIVVLDSARWADFPGGSSPVDGLPTLERLRSESIEFERAIAPSSWTVPSHASILTGRSVAEHRLHARGARRLPDRVPTLPGRLRALGYRSASFSANPLIGPATGLTRDFDLAMTGAWHDGYLRGLSERPPSGVPAPQGLAALSSRAIAEPLARLVQRWPRPFEAALRLVREGADGPAAFGVTGWIEAALDGWLQTVPLHEPTLTFLNYMDAHEPYLGFPTPELDGLEPGEVESSRQDRQAWIRGRWSPDASDFARLRGLYRQTYRVLDRRLARLLEVLKRNGRNDDLLLIVTSDHGQALGEQGFLYHGLRLYEPIVRVPLLVRTPSREGRATRRPEWTSVGEVTRLVEGAVADRRPASDLRPPAADPPEFVISMSDGLLGTARRHVSPERLRTLDRPIVAGYSGSVKLSFDVESRTWERVDLDSDPGEVRPTAGAPRGDDIDLARAIERSAAIAFPPMADSNARLETWGYS